MTRFSTLLLAVCSLAVYATALPVAEVHEFERRAISQSLMNDFEWYVKYASGAYQLFCPVPNGQTLVKQVIPHTSHPPILVQMWLTPFVPSSLMNLRQTRRATSRGTTRAKKSSSRSVGASNCRTSSPVRNCKASGSSTHF